jgi:hypothetical protein
MIRRAFWLGAGAAAGIMGYRRVSAFGRRFSLSGTRTPGSDLRKPDLRKPDLRKPDLRKQRHAVRDTIRFARDVREGMDIYQSRHALPSADALPSVNALPAIDSSSRHRHDRKDGR